MIKLITGDLIQLALAGQFTVIAHGCNCFCTQGGGIARSMSEVFGTDNPEWYPSEHIATKGDINKLARIEWKSFEREGHELIPVASFHPRKFRFAIDGDYLSVVNCYTQYSLGYDQVHVDYDALTLCMRKMARIFAGEKIGLPKIGAGLAGGDWLKISNIIAKEFKNFNGEVTIVEYNN